MRPGRVVLIAVSAVDTRDSMPETVPSAFVRSLETLLMLAERSASAFALAVASLAMAVARAVASAATEDSARSTSPCRAANSSVVGEVFW